MPTHPTLSAISLSTSLLCLCLTTHATAQSTPVSQTRTISATTYAFGVFCPGHPPADTDTATTSAHDFAPWTASLHVHSDFCFGGQDADVSQTSSMLPGLIHAEGTAVMSHGQNGSGADTNANGSSNFSYTFHVSAPTPFTLAGSADSPFCSPIFIQPEPRARVSLDGVFTFDGTEVPGHTTFSTSGTLAPGNYTITGVIVESWGGQPNSSPTSCGGHFSFDLTLIGPCLADFNHDGVLNSQDFFDFLTAFLVAAPSADYNHDGSVNSQDFFDYLTGFFMGCP